MEKDPEEIREEIEETRARMGDTVDAMGYKADVPTRTKEFVADKKDALVSKVRGATPDTNVTESVKGGAQQVGEKAKRAGGIAKENPVGLAVGAAAAGFLVGTLFPSTRMEDERFGEMAENVKETAKEAGQEAFERGKHVAQEAASSAAETAKETGQQEQQELAESLKERTQQTA